MTAAPRPSVYDADFGPAPERITQIADETVRWAAAQIDRTGIVEVVAELRGEQGAPRRFDDRALLTAMLLAAFHGLGMLITDFVDVLFKMISDDMRAELGIRTPSPHGSTPLEDRIYRNVRHRFNTFMAFFDPSVEPKNRVLEPDAYDAARAAKQAAVSEEERELRRARLLWAANRILETSWMNVAPEYRDKWRGDLCVDATFLESHARGPRRRGGVTLKFSSDNDCGVYHRDPVVRMAVDPEKAAKKGGNKGKTGWGVEATVLIAGSVEPDQVGLFPQLAMALAVVHKPGVAAAKEAVTALANIVERGHPVGYLAGDRLYNFAVPESFQLPARALGYKLIFDYRDDQLGSQETWAGAIQVEGAWYCPAMPDPLVEATIHFRRDTDDELYRQRINARRPYELRAKALPDPEGHQRLMCPAAGPNAVAKCPLKPESESKAAPTAVRVLVDSDLEANPPKICRQSTVVFPPTAGAKLGQDLRYGSDEHAAAYGHLRASIEGLNGMVKDGAHEAADDPEKRRVKGQANQTFITAFLLFSANIRKIQAFEKEAQVRDGRLVKQRRLRKTVSLDDYRPAPGYCP